MTPQTAAETVEFMGRRYPVALVRERAETGLDPDGLTQLRRYLNTDQRIRDAVVRGYYLPADPGVGHLE